MRAKFKVLSGERLCEKAFGVNLGEFDSSKSAFASDKSYKSTLTNEVKSLKSTLTNEVKNSKNAFVCEFDSYENAVASQKGALMSAFKTHLNELKRAFASHKGIFLDKCQKGEFESKRVKKNFGVGISLSLSLSLVLAPCALGALEIEAQNGNNWIWVGDYDADNITTTNKATKADDPTNGKVTLTNGKFYNTPLGSTIDKVTVKGTSAATRGNLNINKDITIGTLTLDKYATVSYKGRWGTSGCPDNKCGTYSVNTLIINGETNGGGTSGDISLGNISAKNTAVTGNAKIKVGVGGKTTQGTKVSLGEVSVKDGKLSLGKDDKSDFNPFNLTLQKGGSIDTTDGTNNTKDIITKKLQTLTLEASDGASYDLNGLTFGPQTTIQVATPKATSDADYFATKDKAISLSGIKSPKAPQRYKSERKVIDNGVSKHSGDEITITAPTTPNGTEYVSNITMANYKVGLSDSLQAVLDAGFLARQILIADTMAINSKMMNYKNSQFATLYHSNTRGDALAMRGDERVGDVWVDYDYSNLKDLGESNGNSLDIKSNAVQVGGGVVNSGSTKAAFFVRYTSANAKSTQIQNTYKVSAINAGLFVAQSLWANGYLRGHFSFHNIGVKSDYTLQNTRTGDTSGSFKNGFNYLTTGIGVEQEANFTPALWANLAFDFNHLVALGKANNFVLDDEEEVPSAGADSLTMATFGATFGGKLSYNVILYARAQIGFALANYLDEIEVKAKLDGAVGGGGAVGPTAPISEPFSWSHYNFNGIVGDFGLGLAWQASRKLQVSLEGANLIYGGASSSFNTKLGVDFRF